MERNHVYEKELIQNLQDAGCDDQTIQRFMQADGKKEEMLHILHEQRIRILDALHPIQEELECLDYLIYKIRKAV